MRLTANFVMTVDGKVQGPGKGYWPIGSETDLASLLELRASSDALVHGRLTALGHNHIERLTSPRFQALLAEHSGRRPYYYVVVTAHPDVELIRHITPPAPDQLRVVLATTAEASLPADLPPGVEVWRHGTGDVSLPELTAQMAAEGWDQVALEAGPRLFGALVAAQLVDELHVTVAPKLFGTAFGTPTMINGVLFPPKAVPQLQLISHRVVGSEIFLRYSFVKGAA